MLTALAELAEKCIRYRKANVSIKMLLGTLAAGAPRKTENN